MGTTPAVRVRAVASTRSSRFKAVVAGLQGCVSLVRVPQWIKNGFVLAPVLFAGQLTQLSSVLTAAAACFSFCLLSSCVYVLNDWFDRERDRQHPAKSARPIAAGIVPGWLAWALAAGLLGGALAIAGLLTKPTVVVIELGYLALNLAYNLYLRDQVILDAFAVASGFVLRVWAGAAAISVAASHWLILCTLLLALFLSFSKRRHELLLLQSAKANHRLVLSSYSPELIRQLNVILCSATLISYALYTVSADTVAKFGTDRLVYTVPFVIYGLFRYLYLVEVKGEGGNPSSLVLRDRPLLACTWLWAASCFIVIHFFGRVPPQ